jgi:hypothetical protein
LLYNIIKEVVELYPNELDDYIKNHNGYLGGDDLIKVTSIDENPQLNHIKYDPFNNTYHMWDREGHYYTFIAIPYNETLNEGLVKTKEQALTLKKK